MLILIFIEEEEGSSQNPNENHRRKIMKTTQKIKVINAIPFIYIIFLQFVTITRFIFKIENFLLAFLNLQKMKDPKKKTMIFHFFIIISFKV